MTKKQRPVSSTNHDILTQKRSSGASGRHKTRAEKERSKYRDKWKRGE